jgi:type II secretory pathway component PulC
LARSLALLLLLGCASSQESVRGEETSIEKRVNAPLEADAPPAAAPSTPKGVIARAELEAVLRQGPGAFLQHVDVSPRFSGGRFQGWRVVKFFPDDPRFQAVDIAPGDVVLKVNGRSVEKPEQLGEVWQLLQTAAALEIALERNGEPRTLKWPIQ